MYTCSQVTDCAMIRRVMGVMAYTIKIIVNWGDSMHHTLIVGCVDFRTSDDFRTVILSLENISYD